MEILQVFPNITKYLWMSNYENSYNELIKLLMVEIRSLFFVNQNRENFKTNMWYDNPGLIKDSLNYISERLQTLILSNQA